MEAFIYLLTHSVDLEPTISPFIPLLLEKEMPVEL